MGVTTRFNFILYFKMTFNKREFLYLTLTLLLFHGNMLKFISENFMIFFKEKKNPSSRHPPKSVEKIE